jgi:hypothetical protein
LRGRSNHEYPWVHGRKLTYKGSGHYYTAAALAQAPLAILEEFSLPVSPEVRVPGFPLPLSRFPGGTSCDSVCHLDETGACVRDCTRCPGGVPDGCVDFTRPCPSSACCPPGQEGCYVKGGQFCCPPGVPCCHPETHLCCPEQCCFDHCCGATENCCTLPGAPVGCCPADQACTFQGCCPQQNVPCGDQCCALALPGSDPACCNGRCTDKKTDPNNCGGCGKTCPAPAHAAPICENSQCDFVCNDAGWPTKCGGVCCPVGQSCCSGKCTDTMKDLKNCGVCGMDCYLHAPANSTPTCVSGNCGFVCNDKFSKCQNRFCCATKGQRCTATGCCNICGDNCCQSGQICCNGNCCPPRASLHTGRWLL